MRFLLKSTYRFCNSGRINITVSGVPGSKLMTLSQPKKRKRLFKNPAKMPIRTALEKDEDVFEITDAAASMDLSEKTKRAMELLRGAMKLV